MTESTNKPIENETPDFSFEIYKAESGWLQYRIRYGIKEFNCLFSQVNDPLPDIRNWLEALVMGVQQASFRYDPEADEIKFSYECRNKNNLGMFTITQYSYTNKFIFHALVSREKLICEFYTGFMRFFHSDSYDKWEWESVTLMEALGRLANLGSEEILNILDTLDMLSICTFLYIVNGIDMIFDEDLGLHVEILLNPRKRAENLKKLQGELSAENIIQSFSISDNYNSWERIQEREFIENHLNFQKGTFDGLTWKEFRSSIISRYLDYPENKYM